MRSFVVPSLLCLALVACAPVRDDLRRTELAFEDARYEEVEAWLTALEPEVVRMDQAQRAEFYYLRGMTAFRLGERGLAKHYLALAREEAGKRGLGLRDDYQSTLHITLGELGVPALAR